MWLNLRKPVLSTLNRPTVNDESLEWLKFGRFGELIKFA